MSVKIDMSSYEERKGERTFDEHYNNLLPEQLAVIYSLQKFGYTLWFVRCIDRVNTIAVLRCGDTIVAVCKKGKVEKDPDINLR